MWDYDLRDLRFLISTQLQLQLLVFNPAEKKRQLGIWTREVKDKRSSSQFSFFFDVSTSWSDTFTSQCMSTKLYENLAVKPELSGTMSSLANIWHPVAICKFRKGKYLMSYSPLLLSFRALLVLWIIVRCKSMDWKKKRVPHFVIFI